MLNRQSLELVIEVDLSWEKCNGWGANISLELLLRRSRLLQCFYLPRQCFPCARLRQNSFRPENFPLCKTSSRAMLLNPRRIFGNPTSKKCNCFAALKIHNLVDFSSSPTLSVERMFSKTTQHPTTKRCERENVCATLTSHPRKWFLYMLLTL